MENNSGDRRTEPTPQAWYCGQMKAEALIMSGTHVVTYRYVVVNGCGNLNRPSAKWCSACGRRKARKVAHGHTAE